LKFLCIHGHFYQPPRENPWLEEIEIQESAFPYRNWNERITQECYAANGLCRFVDPKKKSITIVNNYAKISFNFGPTLLSWMEQKHPEVYQAILEADKEGQRNFSGHGAALGQAYNHVIMPLANKKDKETQVVWGIQDFEHRFKRRPEGMWLPETAVDLETLEILSQNHIPFTILSPHQARSVKAFHENEWKDVSGGRIDPSQPYLCHLPSGRSIVLFFYEGSISHHVAFGGLLKNGEEFARRLAAAPASRPGHPHLTHVATDGETYGHHHPFGDMALAHCLDYIQSEKLGRLTVYGEFLEKFPPTREVRILENTSWSCSHGVERWRANCGCRIGTHPSWSQQWRGKLREGLDWLRDELIPIYETQMLKFTGDPWRVRNDYIHVVLDRSEKNVAEFFQQTFGQSLSASDKINPSTSLRIDSERHPSPPFEGRSWDAVERVKILKLLELQRNALLMQTSCGWFFDEISGIEARQVMLYAARAIQLAREIAEKDMEPEFLQFLKSAPSNVPEFGHGACVYEKLIKPQIITPQRVAVHYALMSLVSQYPPVTRMYSYTIQRTRWIPQEKDHHQVIAGQLRVRSEITTEEEELDLVVFDPGDSRVRVEVGGQSYSLWDVFKNDEENLFHRVFAPNFKTVEFNPNWHFKRLLEEDVLDLSKVSEFIEEIKQGHFELDRTILSFAASQKIQNLMLQFSQNPENLSLLEMINSTVRLFKMLPLHLDLWKSQNIYFWIKNQIYPQMMLLKANREDTTAQSWIRSFDSLGGYLHIRTS